MRIDEPISPTDDINNTPLVSTSASLLDTLNFPSPQTPTKIL